MVKTIASYSRTRDHDYVCRFDGKLLHLETCDLADGRRVAFGGLVCPRINVTKAAGNGTAGARAVAVIHSKLGRKSH